MLCELRKLNWTCFNSYLVRKTLERLVARRNSGNAFPSGRSRPRRPLGTASRLGVSHISGNLASCGDSRVLRSGGPLATSLSASYACEPHSERVQTSERGSQTMPMTDGDAWPSRRSRLFEMCRVEGPGRYPIHPFSHSRAAVTFRFFPLFSLHPCIFLGGPLPRLTSRWRSNSHPQWNTDDEFVNESARQRKQLYFFSLHFSH